MAPSLLSPGCVPGHPCTEPGCASTNFSSYRALRDHYMSAHGKFPHACNNCGKRFKEKHSLVNHMAVHGGLASHECAECGKSFLTRERMLEHAKLHLGKRIPCDQCGFKARCRRSLAKHMLMKHRDRRFPCTLCRRRFASRQNLTAHLRTHSGETPWSCTLCGARFKRAHHFRAHLSTAQHLRMLRALQAEGATVPDELNPERNLARRRELAETRQLASMELDLPPAQHFSDQLIFESSDFDPAVVTETFVGGDFVMELHGEVLEGGGGQGAE